MISSDLKQKIIQYVSREISLQELEEWLVPYEAEFLEDAASADADAVSAIELGLAEWSAGIRSETEIREMLVRVIEEHETVETVRPNTGDGPATKWTSSQTYETESATFSSFTMTPSFD